MKIDRLLHIITILLQCKKITAPELARKLEVSRRTIHRDIEDICKAGIPVVTTQGGDGGISIAEGYKLDKSVLTVEELQSIIAGLKSIGSVTASTGIEQLITKLSPKKDAVGSLQDSIWIDLSSHYKNSLSDKINLFRIAIAEKKRVRFDYYSEKGLAQRTIEPCFVTFQWTAWYVFGYCTEREAFRLFKLNRLWRQEMLEESFPKREIPAEELELGDFLTDEHRLTALFDPKTEYLLVEEYGPGSYTRQEDGRLKFSVGYTNREYILRWLLGFGDLAEVIEPADLAEEIRKRAQNILHRYEHDI